jgi:hypothetical protein
VHPILGPILLSWPFVIAFTIAIFYRPLFKLLDKVSSQEVQEAKIGPFEIKETERAYVESLQLLLVSLTTTEEIEYLQKLNEEENIFPFDRNQRLLSVLKRLHSIDFIQSPEDLDKLPDQGNLKDYVELTEKGRKYLMLRDQLAVNTSNRE